MAIINNGETRDSFDKGTSTIGNVGKKGAKVAGKAVKKKAEKALGKTIEKLIVEGLKSLLAFIGGASFFTVILIFCILTVAVFIGVVLTGKVDIENTNGEVSIVATEEGRDDYVPNEVEQALVVEFWKEAKSSKEHGTIKSGVNKYMDSQGCGFFENIIETENGFQAESMAHTCKINFEFSPDPRTAAANGSAYATAIDSVILAYSTPNEFNNEYNPDTTLKVDDEMNPIAGIEGNEVLEKPINEQIEYNSNGEMQYKQTTIDAINEQTQNIQSTNSDFLGFIDRNKGAKTQDIYKTEEYPIYGNPNLYGTYSYGIPQEQVIVGYGKRKVKTGEKTVVDERRFKREKPIFDFDSDYKLWDDSDVHTGTIVYYEKESEWVWDDDKRPAYSARLGDMYDNNYGHWEYKDVKKTKTGLVGTVYIPYMVDFTEYKSEIIEEKKQNLVGKGRCLEDTTGNEYSNTCTIDEAEILISGLTANYIESNMTILGIDDIFYGSIRFGQPGYSGEVTYLGEKTFDYYGNSGEHSFMSSVHKAFFAHGNTLTKLGNIGGSSGYTGRASCTYAMQIWFYDVYGYSQSNGYASGDGRQCADNLINRYHPDKFYEGSSPAPGGIISITNGMNHVLCCDAYDESTDMITITEGDYDGNGGVRIRYTMKWQDYIDQKKKAFGNHLLFIYANPKR